MCKLVCRGCTLYLVLPKKYYLGERLAKKWPTRNGKSVLMCNIGGSNPAPWHNAGSSLPNPVLAWTNTAKGREGVCFLSQFMLLSSCQAQPAVTRYDLNA